RAKELAERSGRRDLVIDLLWVEWTAAATSCRFDEAVPLARALLDIGHDDPDPDVRAQGHDAWGVQCWHLGRITEAKEHLDRARAIHEAAGRAAFDLAAERQLLGLMFWIFVNQLAGAIDDTLERYDALAQRQTDRFAIAS